MRRCPVDKLLGLWCTRGYVGMYISVVPGAMWVCTSVVYQGLCGYVHQWCPRGYVGMYISGVPGAVWVCT